MSERHTVDFDRVSFNIISDAEQRTITLQFDTPLWRREGDHVKRLLKAIGRRYGAGFKSRLGRWLAGERESLLVVKRSGPHAENAEIFCFELGVKRESKTEAALADLVEFFRRLPGYRRLLGQPLDRDQIRRGFREGSSDDSSQAAADTLRRMFERRRQRTDHPTTT